jgi:threonine dehydrogenase-like Zn-dependent dehydrogenase
VLTCAARGVEPCEWCAIGATNRCSRITVGHLAPGLQTGFCKDTGGGWGQQLAAHRSQLHPVPEGFSDEQAILIEPLACAVHTALRAGVTSNDRVLVSGAGSVGLFATLALRQLTGAGEIIVVAKHGHQKELAREFGATEVVAPGEVLRRVRRSTGAFQLKPEFSAPYLLGGVDVAIDAVGSKQSLETALHATRAGGRVVLSGMPAAADLSAAWFRELEVVGTYASSQHEESFRIATELAATDAVQQLAKNVASYPLHRWREALDHAHSAGRLGTVKVAFDPRSSS